VLVVSTRGASEVDVDDFLRGSQLHGHVESNDLIDVEGDVATHVLLESFEIELQAVGANGHLNKIIITVSVRQRVTADIGGFVDQRDPDSCEDGAGGIRDAAKNATARALRDKKGGSAKRKHDGQVNGGPAGSR